jgi:hypothetical protein
MRERRLPAVREALPSPDASPLESPLLARHIQLDRAAHRRRPSMEHGDI